jgi:hypothetical protein
MKRHRLIGLAFAALTLTARLSLTLSARHKSDEQTGDFSKLTFELSSPKEEVQKLEPIPLTLMLCNNTSKALWGRTAIELSDNYVDIFNTRPRRRDGKD